MAFVEPEYTRGRVRRAGEILCEGDSAAIAQIMPIITNWRAAHAYPLNTFQATLRRRLKSLGTRAAERSLVGERLKRLPSIEAKLRRQHGMKLERMQDIAGLRAVVPDMSTLRKLHLMYGQQTLRHELRNFYDYIERPKDDGYRSLHLVYRYKSDRAPSYDGLSVELQIRTRLQHAWATAVETVDIFAKQAIKAGRPDPQWATFFLLASAAFAIQEGTQLPQKLSHLDFDDIVRELSAAEQSLDVLFKLRGYRLAANSIQNGDRSRAAYHLVVLNTETKRLKITQFSELRLDEANESYAAVEELASRGHPLNPVLVAGGSVNQLRRTYPNYFLDAGVFIEKITQLCSIPRFTPVRRSTQRIRAPASLALPSAPIALKNDDFTKLARHKSPARKTPSGAKGARTPTQDLFVGHNLLTANHDWLSWTSFVTTQQAAELIPTLPIDNFETNLDNPRFRALENRGKSSNQNQPKILGPTRKQRKIKVNIK